LRLSGAIKIIKGNWDLSRFLHISPQLSRLLKIFLNLSICWRLLETFLVETLAVKNYHNFQVLTDFSILIDTYGSGIWCLEDQHKSWSRLMFLSRWDKLFLNAKNFSTVETDFITMSRSRLSIETMLDQIETPRPKTNANRPLWSFNLASTPEQAQLFEWETEIVWAARNDFISGNIPTVS